MQYLFYKIKTTKYKYLKISVKILYVYVPSLGNLLFQSYYIISKLEIIL